MKRRISAMAILLVALFLASSAVAQPIVKTVPAVPTNPLVPHDTWSGNAITLKGTVNSPCSGCTYAWDPGDGTPAITGSVSDPYDVEAVYTYTGSPGQVFTATLTVTNNLSQSGSAKFYVKLNNPPPNLPIEVNHAIDEGLWYLHKTMDRATCSDGVNICGNWQGCRGRASACYVGGYYAVTPANLNAFEVNGFLETGSANSPYTETVQRALHGMFYMLATSPVASQTNPKGTFLPDGNANGLGVRVNQANDMYQGGFFMDPLAATGTPGATAATGPPGIVGRTYGDILQDMVDYYAYCQYDYSPNNGGWRYGCNEGPDNSICQWAAIGIIPALQRFGVTVPKPVLDSNQDWLGYSESSAGQFGYTNTSPVWGPYATTPSGMVQLAMDGVGRGDARWDKAETFMRNNFGDPTGSSYTSIKNYFYGLFSFTKSMLLHATAGPPCDPVTHLCTGGTSQPIQMLQSSTAGVNPIDWYSAEKSKGDPTDGVARWLVHEQTGTGYWWGHNSATSDTYPFETAWAVTMLNRTVFEAVPVACANAIPNPVANGGPVQLDGSCSFDQNPAHQITNWDWDVSGTGGTNFTAHGVKVNTNFTTAQPLPYHYPVRLRVTNNVGMTADFVFQVVINVPPTPPSANAGGPYNFCPNPAYTPWYLDGSHSSNADNGKKDPSCPSCPTSQIVAYEWDYACGTSYNSSQLVQPRVDLGTNWISTLQGQSFNVCLRVTNNDNLAFPSAGLTQGLSSVSSGQVYIHNATDVNCTHCIPTLMSLVKPTTPTVPGTIQLYWTDTNDALFPIHHYNVYRSENADFSNYIQIAGANSNPYVAPPLAKPTGSRDFFLDGSVVQGKTYYYRVTPATLNDTETCQSNVTLKATAK